MSRKERRREAVMVRVASGELLLKQAAGLMGVTDRHAVRIKAGYLNWGAGGLMHKSRGMPSNRRADEGLKQKILDTYRERYGDFGPTLACEKMLEYEKIKVARETLRRWLIADGQWRVGKKGRVHRTRRKRRRHFGEMLQIDGSDHLWFEDRGPRTTLMVLVDDATGRIMLHMAEQETTHAALWLLRKWVRAHGVPASIYADRRTVYFTDTFVHEFERRKDPSVFTDFMKVTDRLNIEMIPAYSPQAKGRVERANRTLQDRLVKEFRLKGVRTIAEANAMLDEFAQEMNARFARSAASEADAHRIAPKGKDEWQYYFSTEETRTVQNDNTVVFKGQRHQILAQDGAPPPRSCVTLRCPLDAPAYWVWNERRLKTRPIESAPAPASEGTERPPPHTGASPRAPGI
jgi:hypothetical protein